jgi:hypothetical protein
MKDERREKNGIRDERRIFSWRGHYLYAWAGRKDLGGKGKRERNEL